MKPMLNAKSLSICLVLAGSMLTPSHIASAQTDDAPQATEIAHRHVMPAMKPRIQIALLLDTSNSMDGLISQAKTQLWTLVNELSEGSMKGVKPEIEIALYEYGNDNLSISKHYVRRVLPLTNDLDGVSEKLFGLKTRGGQEYAGAVITHALDNLEWRDGPNDMKLVIIAGNEPFTQGPIDYQAACARAKQKGVIIDTIHCGDEQTGINSKWKDGAECSGGLYMVINQDEKRVHVASPYDDAIYKQNAKLNDTYIGYGQRERAAEFKSRQTAQDSNAENASPTAALGRIASKSKSYAYKNESWDLVDGYAADKDKILSLKEDQLPEELKGMDAEAKAAFIEGKQKEREDIQKQIKSLTKQRAEFIAKKRAEMAQTKTLDNVMVGAIRRQAIENGYQFKDSN